MNSIEEIIAKKPSLDAPLRFYEKAVIFSGRVNTLAIPSRPGQNSYPSEFSGRIVDCFVSVFDMPAGILAPLKQALELGEIDFTRLPLLEVPAFSLPYSEDDLMTLLFLISRPFFFKLHEVSRHGEVFGEEGRCPVCGARPSLSSISTDGTHMRYCSFCGTKGRHDPVGCPLGHDEDTALLNTIGIARESGFTVHTCATCKSYVKTVDGDLLDRLTPDVADLMSLPLDVVIQKRGFKRTSPNPIGMVRMSAGG